VTATVAPARPAPQQAPPLVPEFADLATPPPPAPAAPAPPAGKRRLAESP
jgi:hypothetical protein